jgi:hypothetical protein
MPSRAQRERSDRRRALRVLADAPAGVTEALMMVRPYLDEIARNADHARGVARTLTPRPVAD